jgi:hypothetical protein
MLSDTDKLKRLFVCISANELGVRALENNPGSRLLAFFRMGRTCLSGKAIMKGLGGDLVSFAFNSQVKLNKRTPLYIDADCPSRSLNATQTRTLVRKLIAGFRDVGLRRGDRVVVHLFNNVRNPSYSR